MRIQLNNIGKRFGYKWVIRKVDLHLKPNYKYALIGPNGSGKSTLLKILSGFLTPSEGKIEFYKADRPININEIYTEVSFAAPYVDLIDSFSLEEMLRFHFKFKSPIQNLTVESIVERLNLDVGKQQLIRNFSSGMQQRLKLALAICSDSSILMLDEPTSNLDLQGVQWYHQLIKDFGANRMIIIASNIPDDYHFCNAVFDIQQWKEKVKTKRGL